MKKSTIKRITVIILAAVMVLALGGCAKKTSGSTAAPSTAAETTTQKETTTEAPEATTEAETEKETTQASAPVEPEPVTMRIGSLKGPTSIGLVSLMDKASKGETKGTYEFTMKTQADELAAMLTNGELDIALVPANMASVLYNKTDKAASVININTLGVLYIVTGDDSIKSIADLKGKTVYLTGKGTTPEYTINYLLTANNLTAEDVKLEYKSEATEVAAILKEDSMAVGLLPQPFATVACAQNEEVEMVIDLTDEWDKVQGEQGSRLVTGVTIADNDFINENESEIQTFLEEYKDSVEFVNSDPEAAASLVVAAGIIEKEEIAKQAIPYCNITYIAGADIQPVLSGYLQVLYDQDPQSVGGKLPDDYFYYSYSVK